MDEAQLNDLVINDVTEENGAAIAPSPEAESAIVYLKSVSKSYGSGETIVHALAEVDLAIDQGEYCAIMGVSGSGKSTAMNIMGCLDRPSAGHYWFDGVDVAQLSDAELAQIRNRKIGFVFQQFHLLPQLSALDNVILPTIYANLSPQERRERAMSALQRVGLAQRYQSKPNQLSGGQQQRVAIARALVNEPVMILADEPTGSLDTHTTAQVMALLTELHDSGITIVIVTHELAVARLTQRGILFRDGRILRAHMSPEEIPEAAVIVD